MQACTPDEVQGTYDRIMLSVKGQHTGVACAALVPHLDQQGWVLAMQNGLTETTVAQFAGESRTLGALVNFASDYVGPGRIQFGGLGSLQVGEMDGRDSTRSRQAVIDTMAKPELARRLENEGMPPMPPMSVEETAAFFRSEYEKWGKLVKLVGADAVNQCGVAFRTMPHRG